MGIKSSIEWKESTWDPVTGWRKISEGCDFIAKQGALPEISKSYS
jgi:protein gp37